MSMHADPKTPAETFARHLELTYGLQLDAPRHQALVKELEEYAKPDAKPAPALKAGKKPHAH